MAPLMMNKMKGKPKAMAVGVSPNPTKDYRLIIEGLNLEGTCEDPDCPAYHKRMWIPKGFGKFSLNREVAESVCRLCGEEAS
jgi:hypothetical protein